MKRKSMLLSVLLLTAMLVVLPIYVQESSGEEGYSTSESGLPVSPGLMYLDIVPEPPSATWYVVDPYISSQWDELHPNFGNVYHLFNWVDDNNSTKIDVCDQILLEDLVTHEKVWYHVEWVTVTILVSGPGLPKYLEFDGTKDEFLAMWPAPGVGPLPIGTLWHEVNPVFSNRYNITGATGPIAYCTNLNLKYLNGTIVPGLWHIDLVKTDIVVKPIHPKTLFWIKPARNIKAANGGTIKVQINIADALETYAWEVKLAFNKAVLNVASVTKGTWLSKAGSTNLYNTSLASSNANGWIGIGETLVGAVPMGAAGSGWLVNVTFTVKSVGKSQLNLYDTTLIDMAGNPTDYPNIDGFFVETNVTPVHDVAVTAIVLSSHQVEQGDKVSIIVTILNEGTAAETVTVTAYADQVCKTKYYDRITVDSDVAVLGAGLSTVVNLTWPTATAPGEIWLISANATITVDDDPHDNVLVDSTVHIQSLHDLKIKTVTVLSSKVDKVCTLKGKPYQTCANITVTVFNEGMNAESASVTIYANNTAVGTKNIALLQHPGLLNAKTSIVLLFRWNVSTSNTGLYTIKAIVTITTPAVTEEPKNLPDNTLVDGTVTVMIRDIKVTAIKLLMDHPEGNYPIRRIQVNATNPGTEDMKFAVIAYADPDPPGTPPDGDEYYCGGVTAYLRPGSDLSTTGLGYADGSPGWNLKASPMLSNVTGPKYVVPPGGYTMVAILREDTRYPDKNSTNNAQVTVHTFTAVTHDVRVSDVLRLRRFVYPGDTFLVNVTVTNDGWATENYDITVYAKNASHTILVGTTSLTNLAADASKRTTVTCASTGLHYYTDETRNWYTIFANATITTPGVLADDDKLDNTRTDLTIQLTTYDIVVRYMTSNKPQSYLNTAYPTWNPGVLTFYVTIFNNQTTGPPRTFDVKLYYGNATIEEIGSIGTKSVVNLASQASVVLSFPWNIPSIPKAFPYPTYTIKAKALVVDARPANNILTNRTVTIKWPGDANGDGKVNLSDLSILADHWFSIPTYDPRVDFNMDGLINLSDLSILADNWFKGPLGG